ncbi:hypothetical protein FA15DRAFT_702273 [Coprinopsis marcescibilis]|uniref:Uncharacterized protein n=1 Tax=Coprinopsis marcescibilis TaxID=230819 RepID=A0A5C3L231_COPMA|nr:hypothetical protein FA15DRAFT_702273 [Coprinopsis marcescibilis]
MIPEFLSGPCFGDATPECTPSGEESNSLEGQTLRDGALTLGDKSGQLGTEIQGSLPGPAHDNEDGQLIPLSQGPQEHRAEVHAAGPANLYPDLMDMDINAFLIEPRKESEGETWDYDRAVRKDEDGEDVVEPAESEEHITSITPGLQDQPHLEFQDSSNDQGLAPVAQTGETLDAGPVDNEEDHEEEHDASLIQVPMEIVQPGNPDYENEEDEEWLEQDPQEDNMSSSPRSSSPPALFTSSPELSQSWSAAYSSSPPAVEPRSFGYRLPSSSPDYTYEKSHAIEMRDATRLDNMTELLEGAETHPNPPIEALVPRDEWNIVKDAAFPANREDANEPVLILDELPLGAVSQQPETEKAITKTNLEAGDEETRFGYGASVQIAQRLETHRPSKGSKEPNETPQEEVKECERSVFPSPHAVPSKYFLLREQKIGDSSDQTPGVVQLPAQNHESIAAEPSTSVIESQQSVAFRPMQPAVPNPRRPTIAGQKLQAKKLAKPFRCPTITVPPKPLKPNTPVSSSRDEPVQNARQPADKDNSMGVKVEDSKIQHRTKRAAAQFKSPLTVQSSDDQICVRPTLTIQALERRLQLLKRAVKVVKEEEEATLKQLIHKWTEAGREIAWEVWTLVKDSAAQENDWHPRIGKRKLQDGWGWDKGPDSKKGNRGSELWGWAVDGQDDGSGERGLALSLEGDASEDDKFGPEVEEGEVRQDTIGTMLAQLGICHTTLGWSEEEGSFV